MPKLELLLAPPSFYFRDAPGGSHLHAKVGLPASIREKLRGNSRVVLRPEIRYDRTDREKNDPEVRDRDLVLRDQNILVFLPSEDHHKASDVTLMLTTEHPDVDMYYRIKEISQNHQKRRFIVHFHPESDDPACADLQGIDMPACYVKTKVDRTTTTRPAVESSTLAHVLSYSGALKRAREGGHPDAELLVQFAGQQQQSGPAMNDGSSGPGDSSASGRSSPNNEDRNGHRRRVTRRTARYGEESEEGVSDGERAEDHSGDVEHDRLPAPPPQSTQLQPAVYRGVGYAQQNSAAATAGALPMGPNRGYDTADNGRYVAKPSHAMYDRQMLPLVPPSYAAMPMPWRVPDVALSQLFVTIQELSDRLYKLEQFLPDLHELQRACRNIQQAHTVVDHDTLLAMGAMPTSQGLWTSTRPDSPRYHHMEPYLPVSGMPGARPRTLLAGVGKQHSLDPAGLDPPIYNGDPYLDMYPPAAAPPNSYYVGHQLQAMASRQSPDAVFHSRPRNQRASSPPPIAGDDPGVYEMSARPSRQTLHAQQSIQQQQVLPPLRHDSPAHSFSPLAPSRASVGPGKVSLGHPTTIIKEVSQLSDAGLSLASDGDHHYSELHSWHRPGTPPDPGSSLSHRGSLSRINSGGSDVSISALGANTLLKTIPGRGPLSKLSSTDSSSGATSLFTKTSQTRSISGKTRISELSSSRQLSGEDLLGSPADRYSPHDDIRDGTPVASVPLPSASVAKERGSVYPFEDALDNA